MRRLLGSSPNVSGLSEGTDAVCWDHIWRNIALTKTELHPQSLLLLVSLEFSSGELKGTYFSMDTDERNGQIVSKSYT